jgi:C4-dicarboxylate-specific signal transduction histidine kinase
MERQIKRLQGCINDLIALVALPVMWSGHGPSEILGALVGALVRTLDLDIVYARAAGSGGGPAIEAILLADRHTHDVRLREIGRGLERLLMADFPASRLTVPNPIGEGTVSITRVKFGLNDDLGALVAVSRRPDFPTEIELLLLRVAANQAVTGLQEARLTSQQKRTAEDLEHHVAQRTHELSAVNEELRKEIADHARAEAELSRTKEELAHVSRVMSMGELTASIAHEVKQPLAAITTNGNTCLRWLAAVPSNVNEARSAVERIIYAARRASDVIDRIRAFVKQGDLVKTPLRVDDIVRDVATLVQGELRTHNVSLDLRCDADIPLVAGDRVQLQQVVLNLVLNAVEAMSSVFGRSRVLHLRTGPRGPDEVLVAVQDAGIGLGPGDADRVFDAFFTTKKTGMGMGLAISRSIVESHGGRLWATANPDHGATFQFVLPALNNEPRATDDERDDPGDQ